MDAANNNELSAGLNLNEGDIVECVVEQTVPYGAFVRITENGRKGMIHISELSYSFVKDINEVVKIQDKIKAKIIKIDDRGRIDLSLKQTMPAPVRTPRAPIQANRGNFRPATSQKFNEDTGFASDSNADNNNDGFHSARDFHGARTAYRQPVSDREANPEESDSFEKKMASFLKTSEAKITDLNSRNSARSGRSSRRRSSRD